tara:strand:+ start:211 stop:690 length:480 start_codon:yes stop_codon:yes gene_type:complete
MWQKAFNKELSTKTAAAQLTKSFLAGVEPTGYFTYDIASKTEKAKKPTGHAANIIAGDIGGFAGGAALAAASFVGLGAVGGGAKGAKAMWKSMKTGLKKPGDDRKALAVAVGIPAALNMASADLQYRAGRKQTKKVKKEFKNMSKAQRMHAAETGELYG